MEKCFAYKFDEQKQVWECSALQRTCDGCKLGCKFYKPLQQREKEVAEEKQRKDLPLPIRNLILQIDDKVRRRVWKYIRNRHIFE